MPRLRAIQTVLQAFVDLLTQPMEQDLRASVRGAAASIALVGVARGLLAVSSEDTIQVVYPCLVLVLVWMVVTAVVAKADRRGLAIARNLSVLSFWIAVTLVFVLVAWVIVPDSFARSMRFGVASILLLFFVPLHMFRSLRVGAALGMTLFLWASMGFLAWTLVYG